MESKRQSESKSDDEPAPKRQEKDTSAGDYVPVKEPATADAQGDEHASKRQGEDTSTSNELKQSATSAAALPSADTADVAAAVGIKPGDR